MVKKYSFSAPKIRSVHRVMSVLDQFSTGAKSISALDIANGISFPLTSTYRFIENLVALQYLAPDEAPGRFCPGPRLIRLALIIADRFDIAKVAAPTMQSLAELSGETVTLSILQGDRSLCVAVIESQRPLRSSRQAGEAYPAYAGAIGKVLLAFSENVESHLQKAKLEKFTPATIANRSALLHELAEIRRKGYAISDGEVELGSVGIAIPLLDHKGKLLAALGVMGPKTRINSSRMRELIALATEAAKEISGSKSSPKVMGSRKNKGRKSDQASAA